jgi:hypothetical protein
MECWFAIVTVRLGNGVQEPRQWQRAGTRWGVGSRNRAIPPRLRPFARELPTGGCVVLAPASSLSSKEGP